MERGEASTVYKDLAKIGGATVPFTVEVPDELCDPHPLVVVHGYLGKPFAYDAFEDELAKKGRIVVDVSPPRHQGIASFHPHNLAETILDPLKLQSKALWSVTKKLREDYDDVLDASLIDALGHSLGWPVVVRFAKEKPGVVRTLVNVEGAGNEDHHSTLDFPERVRDFTVEEAIPYIESIALGDRKFEKGLGHAARSEAHYILAHPMRTLFEGMHVTNSYVVDDVYGIKRAQPDVAVLAVLGEDDRLLPAERTVEHSWEMFDEGAVVDCGHLLPMREPELLADTVIELTERVT